MSHKADELEKLKAKASKDQTLPLREGAKNLVFGDGNPEAKIFLLGEAPGKNEDEQGLPFVGAAGKFLDKLLESAGVKREDVWISNVVYFRPPENRPPTAKELAAFASYVEQQLKVINPKIVITLGRFSLNTFLPDGKITKIHGNPQKIKWNDQEITLLPMYHPSAGLRSPDVRKLLEEDFLNNKVLLAKF